MGRFNIEAGTKYRILFLFIKHIQKVIETKKLMTLSGKTTKRKKKQGNKIIKMTILKSAMFYDWTVLKKISEGEKGTML